MPVMPVVHTKTTRGPATYMLLCVKACRCCFALCCLMGMAQLGRMKVSDRDRAEGCRQVQAMHALLVIANLGVYYDYHPEACSLSPQVVDRHRPCGRALCGVVTLPH